MEKRKMKKIAIFALALAFAVPAVHADCKSEYKSCIARCNSNSSTASGSGGYGWVQAGTLKHLTMA